MDKVKFFNTERKSNSKTQKGIPLVVAYHPMLKSLSSIFNNNNIYLLHINIKKLRGHLLHNPWFLIGVGVR